MKKTVVLIILISISIVFYAQNPVVKENPAGRSEYWFEMLKDPATGKIPPDIHSKEIEYVLSEKAGLLNRQKSDLNQWQNIGPWNVGGRTRALAIDLSDSTTILAGGATGGIWRSTDGGNTWVRCKIPQEGHAEAVTAIAQDPREGHRNTWYYVTGEYLGNSGGAYFAYYRGTGIYKSVDSGKTWSQVYVNGNFLLYDSETDYGWNIKVHPDNGYVFAALPRMIMRSTDGENFTTVFNTRSTSRYSIITDVEIAADGTVYATASYEGDNSGIYYSDDYGDTWTEITPASGFPSDYFRIVIAAAPSDPKKVYFLGTTYTDSLFLWVYDKSTNSWTDKTSFIPHLGGATGDLISYWGYTLVIKVKPDDENVVFFGGTNLFRTTDGFQSSDSVFWVGGYAPSNDTLAEYTNHHSDQQALVFSPKNPKILYSGHDGGISYTLHCLDRVKNPKGESIDWISLNNGYLTSQAYTVAIDTTGRKPDVVVAGFQDNGSWQNTSANPADNWVHIMGGDGTICFISNNAKKYYLSSQYGQIFMQKYDGDNLQYWVRVNPDLDTPRFIAPYALDPANQNVMYICDRYFIWRNTALDKLDNTPFSTDPPSDWVKLNNSVKQEMYGSIAVSKNPPDIMFAGTNRGKLYRFDNASQTDPVPVDISSSDFNSLGFINDILIDPNDANKILISFSNYSVISLWYTRDGGQNWINVSGNLEQNPDGSGLGPSTRKLAVLHFPNDTVWFVGTSAGLYSTRNLSKNTVWTMEAPDLIGTTIVDYVVTRDSDKLVVASTHGNGIYETNYKLPQITTTSVEAIRTNLLKVRPNPAKYAVTAEIPFDNARVIISDIKGKVYTFGTHLPKGLHRFDVSTFEKGLYVLQVIGENGKTLTAKFIVD